MASADTGENTQTQGGGNAAKVEFTQPKHIPIPFTQAIEIYTSNIFTPSCPNLSSLSFLKVWTATANLMLENFDRELIFNFPSGVGVR
jgi:hypothetical protein